MLDRRGAISLGWLLQLCMLGTNLFMLWWGIKFVQATWHQGIAEFPIVSVGVDLPADPDRRRDHRLVRDRAPLTGSLFRARPTTRQPLATE